MPPARRLLAILSTALLLTGCGSGDRAPASEGAQEPIEITALEPDPELEVPLPPDMCFVATRHLEIVLTVVENGQPELCERLASYLPREAGRAAWPPDLGPDDALNARCAFVAQNARIDVADLPDRGDGRLDAYRVCDAMVRDGWELAPLVEPSPGEQPPPGTCYVATASFELELGAATDRGQSLCDELADEHVAAPVAHRTPPVATDRQFLGYGDVACEGTRGRDRVHVMHLTDERGRDAAETTCDSLQRGGWKVARWG